MILFQWHAIEYNIKYAAQMHTVCNECVLLWIEAVLQIAQFYNLVSYCRYSVSQIVNCNSRRILELSSVLQCARYQKSLIVIRIL